MRGKGLEPPHRRGNAAKDAESGIGCELGEGPVPSGFDADGRSAARVCDVAALYVQKNGCYFGLEGVDPWDETRDAREYAGPWPVVAHPPCARWCRLAQLVESTGGRRVGDDDGCFAAALAAVRTFGGVLEHPAFSLAWSAHDLPTPLTCGGWTQDMFRNGWACHVEQGHYGHAARKATWLYAANVELPRLRWGESSADMVVTTSRRTRGIRREMPKSKRIVTPPAFRDLLLSIARTANTKETP